MIGPFLPEKGKRPARRQPRRDERVLHICLRVPGDPQKALENALRSLASDGGQYMELDWRKEGAHLPNRLFDVCRTLKPTLIFAQIQTPGILTGGEMDLARRSCDPDCVMVQWDGDHRHDHVTGPDRSWFVNLAGGCDINAVVCTRDVEEYASMGVKGAAYLQIGVDADIWQPTTPDIEGADVVLLAGYYSHLGYQKRREVAERLTARYPSHFAVYGQEWVDNRKQPIPVNRRHFLAQHQEAAIYSRSLAALSISIRNDLPRYSSDRLLRCLASGALTLVDEFPDMAGLGLKHGINCLVWTEFEELCAQIDSVLQNPTDPIWSLIRNSARELALTHTWDSRMFELAAMVEAVRAGRVPA